MPEKKNILAVSRPRRKKPDYFDKEIGSDKQKEIADKIAKIFVPIFDFSNFAQ